MTQDLDRDFVDGVLAGQAGRPGALLGILQQVQEYHPRKYLPREALDYIALKTGIPPARIFSVATDPTSVSVHSTIQRGSSGHQRTSPTAAARANAPAAITAQGYAARIDSLGIDTQGRSDIPPTVGYRQ